MARRYGVDPYTVLEWDPDRVALAVACYEQAVSSLAQAMDKGGLVPAVVAGQL